MWPNIKPYIYVLPTAGVLLILFVGGLIEGLIQSLGYFPAAGQYGFSLDYYRQLLSSSDFWDSLILTFRIALLSSLSAGVLGMFVSVCLFMLKRPGSGRKNQIWQRFFQLPLIVPHLVWAYLMVLLFTQSGWLSRILASLGWIHHINDFPVLVNDSFGGDIIFTYAWKEAPFIALMIYPVLLRIHGSWFEASRVFGANRWSFFREILLPLLMPTWISSSFIVFAFTFSAFEVPFLLGVTYPRMLPVLSYNLYTSGGLEARPEALAVNVILAVIVSILGVAAYRLSQRWSMDEQGGW
ncbi:putative spermidine/putrescine transport system permease protein [Scopulibacillus darangshiensis]|uniref:Putative spermidine/putrescine transport system permease protein n=1 Tax=Scopulibacillus darangshiensis TaxID=442528 RepID=A0A4R2P526_9BACL|nr:ABC transporter permease subunit [Scopulibacillus darangshiensis]TCP29939.1 putative spermidine/putrescine transport system permease protein [Scopulibacillus darangshiensis]